MSDPVERARNLPGEAGRIWHDMEARIDGLSAPVARYPCYCPAASAQCDEPFEHCDRVAPAAPDRPGDRDQQQAAEVWCVLCGRSHAGSYCFGEAPPFVPDEREEALAAARAGEAARWRAKIEALIAWAKTDGRADVYWISRLRAVLDGEQR